MIYGGRFDLDEKQKRIKELEELVQQRLLNDKQSSEKVISELNNLKQIVNNVVTYKEEVNNHIGC